jgi:hypothetical protein
MPEHMDPADCKIPKLEIQIIKRKEESSLKVQ